MRNLGRRISNLDREELAWAAGFFDGEGNTCLRHPKKGKMPSIVAQISQSTGPSILIKFKKSIGGIGTIGGPYTTKGGLPVHTLSIYGFEEVQAVLALIWRWLGEVKRDQAVEKLAELGALKRDAYLRGLSCPAGHLWGGVAGQRGATFSINIRGTKVCRICKRGNSRKRNDINRKRKYNPRMEMRL